MKIKDFISLGLFPVPKPQPYQQAGKFGYSGKMVIKPFSVPPEQLEDFKRLFLKHVKITICGCWEWQGRIHNGYGCCSVPGGNTKWAHRVSYAIFKGPIAEQRHIDHVCRNKKCVAPHHLRQTTPIENYLAVHRRKKRDEKWLKEQNGQLTIFEYLKN